MFILTSELAVALDTPRRGSPYKVAQLVAFAKIMGQGYAHITCEEIDDVLMIKITTDVIPRGVSSELSYELDFLNQIDKCLNCQTAVIDFSDVECLNIDAMGGITRLNKALQGNLFLFGLNDNVKEVFRTSDIDRMFSGRIFDTKPEALTALKNS